MSILFSCYTPWFGVLLSMKTPFFMVVLLSSMSYVIFCRSLLGSVLKSQAALPTVKNLHFAPARHRNLKNQRLGIQDDQINILRLSGAPFGSPWESPGGILGLPSGLWIDQRGPPDSSWNSLGPRLLASCCRRWPWERSGAVFGSFGVLPKAS